jgi:hypothetical protein
MPVCWHQPRRHCRLKHDGHISYGRIRSGAAWFWWAGEVGEPGGAEEHGRADTEHDALTRAQAAAENIAGDRLLSARQLHGAATEALKRLTAAKRAAKPPADTTDANPVEWLYGYGGATFRIIKKTPQRVFYVLDDHRGADGLGTIRHVDRRILEADGMVGRHSRAWWESDRVLFTHEQYEAHRPDTAQARPEDLRRLHRDMVDAHPDRGGSAEAFRTARKRYLAAKQRAARAPDREFVEGETAR